MKINNLILMSIPILLCFSIIECKGQETQVKLNEDFIIKGVLVNKDGSPVSKATIIAYPLNSQGTPLFVSTFIEIDSSGSTPESWNPRAESDTEGRFEIKIPRISHIGDDPKTEFTLGLNEPPGGWIVGTVSNIYYANPEKKEEMCFIVEGSGLSLLHFIGGDSLRIKIEEKSGEVDLGKVSY